MPEHWVQRSFAFVDLATVVFSRVTARRAASNWDPVLAIQVELFLRGEKSKEIHKGRVLSFLWRGKNGLQKEQSFIVRDQRVPGASTWMSPILLPTLVPLK